LLIPGEKAVGGFGFRISGMAHDPMMDGSRTTGARLLLARDYEKLKNAPLPGVSTLVVNDLLWSFRLAGSDGTMYEVRGVQSEMDTGIILLLCKQHSLQCAHARRSEMRCSTQLTFIAQTTPHQ
jgi:hypothetical protein